MTEYYDVTRIQRRHKILLQNPNFSMAAGMLENGAHEEPVFFKTGKADTVPIRPNYDCVAS